MGTIHLTWWNLGNFFDTDDDPISRDFDFTVGQGWTQAVFEAKKANLAAALNATHGGAGPELLAVAEIEKDSLLEQLIDAMGKPHLKVVRDVHGTSDLRGIDVAMAYDERKLRVVACESHVVHLRYRTRDIFEVVFELVETGQGLVVIASHWPSRKQGRYQTEPLRIAVAEHIAYLVEGHLKVSPEEYELLREQNNLGPIRQKWEAKVMVVGDFNDEPGDRSLVDHLRAGYDLDRVVGVTNDIDQFEAETGAYRARDAFLFNTVWRFVARPGIGSYFIDSDASGHRFTNRYQMIDQLVVSRGLLGGLGLALDLESVDVFRDPLVATGTGRPRPFNKSTRRGTSDHLPLIAMLRY